MLVIVASWMPHTSSRLVSNKYVLNKVLLVTGMLIQDLQNHVYLVLINKGTWGSNSAKCSKYFHLLWMAT